MREEMNTIKKGLAIIGHKGKLSPFGFDMDEITEIIEEDTEEARIVKEEEIKWRTTLLPKKERERLLVRDGIISKEKVFELRRKFLWDLYEKAVRNLEQAKVKGEPISYCEKIKNRIKFEYEIFTFQPNYPKDGISQAEIERADERNISDFISAGRWGFINCVFHNEKTPSLHISKNKFYCFGCGAKGRTINFIMKWQNVGFQEAVKFLR